MAYSATLAMSNSQSLRGRCVAAAAEEGIDSPDGWVAANWWKLCATSGWSDKWQYAVDNMTLNANSDIGIRDDVIGDADIQSAVQALKG
jgi:hypothetical protein